MTAWSFLTSSGVPSAIFCKSRTVLRRHGSAPSGLAEPRLVRVSHRLDELLPPQTTAD